MKKISRLQRYKTPKSTYQQGKRTFWHSVEARQVKLIEVIRDRGTGTKTGRVKTPKRGSLTINRKQENLKQPEKVVEMMSVKS